jgi:hypothetical protein
VNAWAKPETQLICGDCFDADEEIQMMTAQAPEEDEQAQAA